MKTKKAFTLIELLVVIAIIGILSTLAVVSLQNARKSARDAKRIADVKQMQTALELYFNDWQTYPATLSVTAGESIGTDTVVYMVTVPTPPSPEDCSGYDISYKYGQKDDGGSYVIDFCLGGNIGSFEKGSKCAHPGGVSNGACN